MTEIRPDEARGSVVDVNAIRGYIFGMNTPQDLLRQLASIDQMERGTLSFIRETASGPCCNFQRWEAGRHRSEYIPADQVARVRENLEAYSRFEALVREYVDAVSEHSRQQRLAGAKKKRPTSASASPKRPRSTR